MILWSILISLIVLGLVIIYITRPLVAGGEEVQQKDELDDVTLNAEYQVALNRIRELEQEHLEGKIDEADYLDRRENLNQEAANILKQLHAEE